MQNKKFRLGPLALTTNILNPPTVTRTEIIGTALSVPANSVFDWYGALRLDAADFLVGGAGTTTALTMQAEGAIGVAG